MGARSRVLRIIAGRHRGRRLQFPAGVDIRPTPDRVRETLFNWLQPRIEQARVLDLFAGSGALGLEALSRGAAHVTFVEKDRRAAAAIEAVTREWGEAGARVSCTGALEWLVTNGAEPPFDIVFLDPPYDSNLLETAPPHLQAGSLPTHACTSNAALAIRFRRCRVAGKSFAQGVQARSGIICSPHETQRRLSRNLRPHHQWPPGPGAPRGGRV
jgi:16S rRNA (guanine966-N2)-methyltransferase